MSAAVLVSGAIAAAVAQGTAGRLRTDSEGKRGHSCADKGVLEQVGPPSADQRGRVRVSVVVRRGSEAGYDGQSSQRQ